MHPKAGFRLWLTAEVHPRFPPILLQSSLKITYEVLTHTQTFTSTARTAVETMTISIAYNEV